jgi:hypothetical protein
MVDAAGVTGRGRSAGPTRATLRMAVRCAGALAVSLAAAPAAHATPEPASTYDTPGQRHTTSA